MIRERFLRWLRRKANQVILAFSETRVIHGIPVLVTNTLPDTTNDDLYEKIAGALGLIAEYEPMRLRRLQRDFVRIWITRQAGYRASFLSASRSCKLDTFFVATFSEAEIASSVIHEAVHARVHASGVQVYDRAREERLCRRAELKFGRAVPEGEAVVERAQESLALMDEDVAPEIDWEQIRRIEAQAALRELQAPLWIKRQIARWKDWDEMTI